MRGQRCALLFLLILGVNLLSLMPVAAERETSFELSVKLTLDLPVMLNFLEPVTLFYQPEKDLVRKPHLPFRTWRAVEDRTISQQSSWQVQMTNGRIILLSAKGDTISSELPLLFRGKEGGFTLNGEVYPGTLLLWPEGDNLLFFNEVNLEDYVCGVLGREAYASWPLEALKANAVAIRSYTLYSLGRHTAYDFCADEHCQVYRGLPEAEVFRTAVAATAGEVLTWQGAPINAVYHSSSGGRTRNNEEVWAGPPLPYLRAVDDFDQNGKNYQWPQTYRFSLEEVGRIIGVPGEKGLVATPLYNQAGERVGFCFAGDGRTVQLKNEELRRLLLLPSANFRVLIGPEERELTQEVTLPPATTLLFIGNGAGHGVGLSQWGAAALAAQGYTYRQILRHYYGSAVRFEYYLPPSGRTSASLK
ncbi:MAG: SpoIID/LytB domain-containing protein [Firmicutes bacterium]|nr:SpoIID/LytB domain-containing protein [Bacillota bacterium]